MILFLDTEFSDFYNPELISIGLVSECGRMEFYAERTDFDQRQCNEFVRTKVLPKLGHGPCFTTDELAAALRIWLDRVHALDVAGIVLVLYDFDTDFALLKNALSKNLPVWLEGANIGDEINRTGWTQECLDGLPTAHHALHDAKELRADWIASQP